jgi:hypothetical protein
MKYYLYISFFLITSTKSFSQLSLKDLMNIYTMSFDQFEKYSIFKGYELYKLEDHPKANGIYYKKGRGKDTRYIGLFSKFLDDGIKVKYQTSISSEILSLKDQMKGNGFNQIKSEPVIDHNGAMMQRSYYRNKIFQVDIFTIPPSVDEPFPSYEIGLHKY